MSEDDHKRRHREARGKKLTSLSDLSKEMPSEQEIAEFNLLLDKESDRGAAIMASALVERALKEAIPAFIVDPGKNTLEEWFDKPVSPFATFSAKIALGRALAIFNAEEAAQLDIIRKIRNAFAHTARPLTFSEDRLSGLCTQLVPAVFKGQIKTDGLTPRVIYGRSCRVYAHLLLRRAERRRAASELEAPDSNSPN